MIRTWRSATVTLQPRAGRDMGEIPASATGESWVMLEAQSREPSGVGGGGSSERRQGWKKVPQPGGKGGSGRDTEMRETPERSGGGGDGEQGANCNPRLCLRTGQQMSLRHNLHKTGRNASCHTVKGGRSKIHRRCWGQVPPEVGSQETRTPGHAHLGEAELLTDTAQRDMSPPPATSRWHEKEEKGTKQELWGISESKGKATRHLGQPGAEGTVSHLLN